MEKLLDNSQILFTYNGQKYYYSNVKNILSSFLSISNEISNKNIFIEISNPCEHSIAVLGVFLCGGIITPLKNLADVIISNNDCSYKNKTVFNYDNIIKLNAKIDVYSIKSGSFLMPNGSIRTDEHFQNFVEFHKNILKVKFDNTIILSNNVNSYGYLWLLPLFLGNTINFVSEMPKNIPVNSTVILSINDVNRIINNIQEDVTILSYGTDIIEYQSIANAIFEKNSRWYQHYGFPYVYWLSAVKEFSISGKSSMYHIIKPITNYGIQVKNDMGDVIPYSFEGTLVETHNNIEFGTMFNGIANANGTIAVLGCTDRYFCENNIWFDFNPIIDVARKLSDIQDVDFCQDTIFYSTTSDITYKDLKYFIESSLNITLPNISYCKVPYLIRNRFGYLDYANMNLISSKVLDSIESSINSQDNHKLVSSVSFKSTNNNVQLPTIFNRKSTNSVMSNKLSIIDGGVLDMSKNPFDSLTDLIHNRKNSNQKIVFHENDTITELTYSDLYKASMSFANGLRKKGIGKDTHVIFQIESNIDFVKCFWGCMLIGAIAVPFAIPDDKYNTIDSLGIKRLIHIVEVLENPYIIVSDSNKLSFNNVINKYNIPKDNIAYVSELVNNEPISYDTAIHKNANDVCLIIFTSGSTGLPKGVQLTEKNIFARTIGEIEHYGLSHNERDLNWLTLTHAAGIIWTHIRDIFMDIFQVQVEGNYILENPARWLELTNQYNITITWAPNFAFSLIQTYINNDFCNGMDFSNLKYIFSGGESNVSSNLRNFIIKLYPYGLPKNAIRPAFGMAETSSCITYFDDFTSETMLGNERFVPIGVPMAGCKFRITDGNGNILPEGVAGSLEGTGLTFTKGYYKNPSANQSSFTNDGYLITGDIAIIKDGIITITGRNKDIIIINGVNYYVQDFESVVDEVEEVNSSYTVACSVLDENSTERVLIFFTPLDETLLQKDNISTLNVLISKLSDRISKKCGIIPDYIIPLSASDTHRAELGKKDRNKYRENFLNGIYDDIINAINIESNCITPILEEVWKPCHIQKSILDINSTVIITDEINLANKYFKGYKTISSKDSIPINTITVIDLCVIENEYNKNAKEMLAILSERAKNFIKISKDICVKRFIIPTINGIFIDGDKDFVASAGIVRGFINSMQLEIPHISFCVVDFDKISIDYMSMLLNGVSKKVSVYRNHSYFNSVMCNASVTNDVVKITDNDTILIIGGLGGVGLNLSKWLIRQFNSKLIIIGSTPLEENNSVNLKLKQLQEETSNVQYICADITNYQNVDDLVTKAENILGDKVSIIFNLAGRLSSKNVNHWNELEKDSIENITNESIFEVGISKEDSTYLAQYIRERRSSVKLIIFSSVNGFFGGSSLSVYSAYCSFQEEYCKSIKEKYPNTYCINWSRWKDLGLTEKMPSELCKITSSSGFVPFTLNDNLRYLLYILQNGIKNPILGLNICSKGLKSDIEYRYSTMVSIWHNIQNNTNDITEKAISIIDNKDININVQYVENLLEYQNGSLIDIDSLIKSNKYNDAYCEKFNDTQQKVFEIWKELLGIQKANLDDDFFSCGGNSVLISRLVFMIKQRLYDKISFIDVATHGTIRSIAKLIDDSKISYNINTDEEEIDKLMEKDAIIDFDIQKMINSCSKDDGCNNILLTGASGFLGAFVLKELLNRTSYNIVCLIRADDYKIAKQRVLNNLNYYGIADCLVEERVSYVTGDIEKINLGMNIKSYKKLCDNISIIYHVASMVQFTASYNHLREANVIGTKNILKCAVTSRLKKLYYISSATVYESMSENQILERVDEHTNLTISNSRLNGYNRTKLVSDLILKKATEYGLECKIFRIGTLTGDSLTGRCQTKDFMWLLVRGFVKLKKLPILDNTLRYAPVPVDIMAEGIVGLSLLPYDINDNVFLLTYDVVYLNVMEKWTTMIKGDMPYIEYSEWVKLFENYANTHHDNMMLSMLASLPKKEFLDNMKYFIVDNSHTTNLLKNNNLRYTGSNFERFKNTFKYFEKTGFFN